MDPASSWTLEDVDSWNLLLDEIEEVRRRNAESRR